MTVRSILLGIAISLAAVFFACNITPVAAVEAVSTIYSLEATSETPIPTDTDQDEVSLARIIAFEKRIASKRVSEAERREIAQQIVRYSRILGIQPELGAALIAKESRFNPRASSRGHRGLGQLCASAARNMGIKKPFDIEQSVRGTLAYLKLMMDMWKERPDSIERALASYNSGAGAVRSRGPGISRSFIRSVLKYQAAILNTDVAPDISEDTVNNPEETPTDWSIP